MAIGGVGSIDDYAKYGDLLQEAQKPEEPNTVDDEEAEGPMPEEVNLQEEAAEGEAPTPQEAVQERVSALSQGPAEDVASMRAKAQELKDIIHRDVLAYAVEKGVPPQEVLLHLGKAAAASKSNTAARQSVTPHQANARLAAEAQRHSESVLQGPSARVVVAPGASSSNAVDAANGTLSRSRVSQRPRQGPPGDEGGEAVRKSGGARVARKTDSSDQRVENIGPVGPRPVKNIVDLGRNMAKDTIRAMTPKPEQGVWDRVDPNPVEEWLKTKPFSPRATEAPVEKVVTHKAKTYPQFKADNRGAYEKGHPNSTARFNSK